MPLRVRVPAPVLVIVPEPRRAAVVRLLAPVRVRAKPALSSEPVKIIVAPVAVTEELAFCVRFRPMV